MGRNIKRGLDYFPFDTDFFQDLKIRKLVKYQGGKAVTVYALLLCNIYKQGYYMRWDEELPFIISELSGYDEAYVREVLKCCLYIGLFDKNLFDNNKILSSKGIQERYTDICRLCKRKGIVSEFSLISSEEIIINSEETLINSEESTQRKVKKRKENKTKEEVKEEKPPSPTPSLNEILNFFFTDFADQLNASGLCKQECRRLGLKVLSQWELSGWKRSRIKPGAGRFNALMFLKWLRTEARIEIEQFAKQNSPKPKAESDISRMNRESEERRKQYEHQKARAIKPRDYIRLRGYDPDKVTMANLCNPDWVAKNPPNK